ncbi:MAG: hypothetical protein M3R62_13960 [Acidobacteriota bacterium]|nr:hypothetical protein [Acidobacteriota bacterium]
MFLLLGALYAAVAEGVLPLPGTSFNLLHRLPLALFLVAGIVFAERALEHFGISRLESTVYRYNLTRIIRLSRRSPSWASSARSSSETSTRDSYRSA